MSLLRGLSVFVLSLVFTSFIFMSLTSYALGPLIQKDSMKGFLNSEGEKFVNQQCGEECSQQVNLTDCESACQNYTLNQTKFIVDHAIDEMYQRDFFGVSMNDVASQAASYLALFVIGIVFGILLLAASESPISTMGKNLLSISIALFLLVIAVRTVMMVANIPLSIGGDFIGYLSPGLDQIMKYGIYLIFAGLILIAINYLRKRRAKAKDKK